MRREPFSSQQTPATFFFAGQAATQNQNHATRFVTFTALTRYADFR
jgi:hypothetical protein